MAKKQTKRGLIIGMVVFIFLVLAGAAGMWLFSNNTDNRSQAAAEPVATVKILMERDTTGLATQTVAVDISQMKAGTSVTEFYAQIFVPTKTFIPPNEQLPSKGPVFVTPTSPMGKATMPPPPPNTRQVTSAPVPDVSFAPVFTETQVLGVTTDNRMEVPVDRSVTKQPVLQNTILAQSKDGYLKVRGANQFAMLQNVKVTIESQSGGYLVTLTGLASAKNLDLQRAFIKAQPLFGLIAAEAKIAFGTPEVRLASVKGYLPGLQTVVELTKPVPPTPTLIPEKPPQPATCKVTKDCPQGYSCEQPPMPTCPKGKVCSQALPARKCVLMKPTQGRLPSKTPPNPQPTGRPVIIKSVR